MRLVIASEERFSRSPDGSLWTSAQGHYGFWQRYLTVFDHVAIAARVLPLGHGKAIGARADGEGVSFIPIPHYLGPQQYARRYFQVRKALRAAFGPDDAVLLRLPAQIATTMAPALYRDGRPYGVEVVGDPYDVFAPGAVTHPLRPYFRWIYTRAQKQQVERAAATAYVTEHTLQRRYPACESAFSTHYSSVELAEEAYIRCPRSVCREGEALRLVTVGSFAHMYKGIDVLLRSVRSCLDRGVDVRLRVAGDGRHRSELEALASSLSLRGHVTFLGQLPSSVDVRTEYDRADAFVLASRTEGLPRAMIEAMARGLPCVGTRVGGIPELLPDGWLVPAEDHEALADRIMRLVSDRETVRLAASRNLAEAEKYRSDILAERRVAFYRHLRDMTQEWLKARAT